MPPLTDTPLQRKVRISGMNRRSSAQKVTADRQNQNVGRRKLADLVQNSEKTLYPNGQPIRAGATDSLIYWSFKMDKKLSLKVRRDCGTVQLVFYRYCPVRKRSITVTVGSLRKDADPDDLRRGLRLRPGWALSPAQLQQIRDWLTFFGDLLARQYRKDFRARVEAEYREAEALHRRAANPFAEAEQALARLAAHLPALVAESTGSAWSALRPQYLSVMKAADALLHAAQAQGIAKQLNRRKTRGEPLASKGGAVAEEEAVDVVL